MLIVDNRASSQTMPQTIIPRGFILTPYTRYGPIVILVVCFYCYYVATTKGEVKPFPYCTITQTATPYPQNILFRYVMSAFGMIVLILFTTAYFVINSYSQLYADGKANVPCAIHWFTIVGTVFFQLAINTIDSGKMDDLLHTSSAVIFFILWAFVMFMITYSYWKLSKSNPDIISKKSLNAKIVVVLMTIALLIEEILHSIKVGRLQMDPEVPIMEWGVVIYLAAFVYTFTWDWQDLRFVLDTDYTKTQLLSEPVAPVAPVAVPSQPDQIVYYGLPVQYQQQ